MNNSNVERMFEMTSGGPTKRITRGRYSLTGGQDLIFWDDPATPGGVGCQNEDIIAVLVDRMGPDAIEALKAAIDATKPAVIAAPVQESPVDPAALKEAYKAEEAEEEIGKVEKDAPKTEEVKKTKGQSGKSKIK